MVSIRSLALDFILAPCSCLQVFFLLDMDVGLDVDPIPTANVATFPASSAPTAPETSTDQEVIAPTPVQPVASGVDAENTPVPPATSGVTNAGKSSTVSVAALGGIRPPPTSVSV